LSIDVPDLRTRTVRLPDPVRVRRGALALSIIVGVLAASILVPAVLLSSGIQVSGYQVDSRYAGPPTLSAQAYAIGLRPTGASGALPSVPFSVTTHANLTAMWSIACGGNASDVCNITSVTVNAPFEIAYSPLQSNVPWVWTGIHGGDEFFEEVFVTGPESPGTYGLTVSVTVTETPAT